MDKISVLNNSTKVFQVFGLQCFSLNSLNEKNGKKYPSLTHLLHLVFMFIMLTLSFGSLFFIAKSMKTQLDTTAENNLITVTRSFTRNLLIIAYTVSLALSFLKCGSMKRFFQNTKTISEICARELNHKVNYKNLNRNLWMVLIFSLAPVFFAVLFVILHDLSTNDLNDLYKLITFFPILFNLLLYVRFYFYVRILNFQLELLETLISSKFSSGAITKGFIEVSTLKNLGRKNFREVRAFNYLLVKDMTKQVNSSMSWIVLILILLFVLSLIRFGYQAFMYIFGFKLNLTSKLSLWL